MTPDDARADARADEGRAYWTWRGIRGLWSPAALILMTAHLGFAGLARDAGIGWLEASFMVATIWALPANIILIGAISSGLSLVAAAVAVSLSSLRLMPMVVALMPELRHPGMKTRTLLVLSHFCAVTGWVFAMQTLKDVPRAHRGAYFGGFAGGLCAINTLIVAVAYNLVGELPALATGALAFLTPVYFLNSLFGSARDVAGRVGLFTGMAALPPAHWLTPDLDILVAGLAGGLAAFLIGRAVEGRAHA